MSKKRIKYGRTVLSGLAAALLANGFIRACLKNKSCTKMKDEVN